MMSEAGFEGWQTALNRLDPRNRKYSIVEADHGWKMKDERWDELEDDVDD